MSATVRDMEKQARKINLDRILLDDRCQPREKINQDTINHYAERIDCGDVFPPITVVWDGESFWCCDGFHRVLASRHAGLVEINAIVAKGAFQDALRLSLSANSKNGMQRTKADITRSIGIAWHDLDLRKTKDIAELLECSEQHVRKVTNQWRQQEKENRDAEIIRLAEEGRTQREIAAEVGVAPMTVNNLVNDVQKRNSFVFVQTADDQTPEPPAEPTPEPPPLELTESRKPPEFILLNDWIALSDPERADLLNYRDDSKTLNKQDNTSIEWAQWSWNPITGCRHDCPYCYARDIAERFYKQGFEPSFYPGRLTAPTNTKVPAAAQEDIAFKNIFTCSMADLFGRWVPAEWIEAVLREVRKNPQWNFLFLTKFPKRMAEFDFPVNAWLGTTVDCQARVKAAEDAFSKISGGTKWLSVEPMLEPLKFSRLSLFDWVVIGGASASTKTPEWVPPIDWIVNIHDQARKGGCRIYYKTNCGMLNTLRIREFPWKDPETKRLPEKMKYLNMK